MSVDPRPVAFSVSPDPGLTPGQRQAPRESPGVPDPPPHSGFRDAHMCAHNTALNSHKSTHTYMHDMVHASWFMWSTPVIFSCPDEEMNSIRDRYIVYPGQFVVDRMIDGAYLFCAPRTTHTNSV